MSDSLHIVTLCTGNVARSVMLGFMLTTLADSSGADWEIRTAGTHVAEGMAMSGRTRDALMAIEGIGEHRYGAHRSHQLDVDDVAWADIVLASEADHVRYVRERFAGHGAKVVRLHQFVRDAPLDATFAIQLAAVAALELDPALDIADPAGGDQALYNACARQLWELAQAFSVLVTESELD